MEWQILAYQMSLSHTSSMTQGVSMSVRLLVGWSVHYFGPDLKITISGWIAMKFYTHIHGSQRMNS